MKLTEAERTLLENLNTKRYYKIGRQETYSRQKGWLYLKFNSEFKNIAIQDSSIDNMFPDLFKEIKERRRILNKRIVGR